MPGNSLAHKQRIGKRPCKPSNGKSNSTLQLKGLNGESARNLLIDLFDIFKLSWDPNSFRPLAASQGNVRA